MPGPERSSLPRPAVWSYRSGTIHAGAFGSEARSLGPTIGGTMILEPAAPS